MTGYFARAVLVVQFLAVGGLIAVASNAVHDAEADRTQSRAGKPRPVIPIIRSLVERPCESLDFYPHPVDFEQFEGETPGKRTVSIENKLFCMTPAETEQWLTEHRLSAGRLPPHLRSLLVSDPARVNGYPLQRVVEQGATVAFRLGAGVLTNGLRVSEATITNLASGQVVSRLPFANDDNHVPRAACEKFFGSGCNYPYAWTVSTGQLEPGAYAVRFRVTDQSDAESPPIYFFVNRSGAVIDREIALLIPTFTMQAYSSVGGASLYKEMVESSNYRLKKTGRLHEVSLYRPLIEAPSKPRSLRNFSTLRQAISLLEANNWKIRFFDDQSLHDNPAGLDGFKLATVFGHAEYWTQPMYDALVGFLDEGGRLANFSGNMLWWKPRLSPDGAISLCRCPWSHERPARFRETGRITDTRRLLGVSMMGYKIPHDHVELAAIGPRGSPLLRQYHGITVLEPGHSIFEGIDIGDDGAIATDGNWMYSEIDGVKLKDDGTLDAPEDNAGPYRGRILGTSYVVTRTRETNGMKKKHFNLRPIGFITELPDEHGHPQVISAGSMGFVDAVNRDDPEATRFFTNTMAYLWEAARVANNVVPDQANGRTPHQD